MIIPLANEGVAEAQNMIGVCYYNGNVVEQNYSVAVEWFRKAAEQGEAWANYNLGLCYEKGKGVEVDFKTAIKWYRTAADYYNHVVAQIRLAEIYYEVMQDKEQAMVWYRKAAEQGNAHGQYALAYYLGMMKEKRQKNGMENRQIKVMRLRKSNWVICIM